MTYRTLGPLTVIGLVVLVGMLAICAAGCLSWNTVEEGAVRLYVGADGEMRVLPGDDDLGTPAEPYPGSMASVTGGTPGIWVDLNIVQGSEASPKTDAKAAASVAATGQGSAQGGTADLDDSGDTSTDTRTGPSGDGDEPGDSPGG